MTARRKKRLSALGAVGVLLTASCSSRVADEAQGKNLARVSVRLLWLDQAQFAGIYAAKAKGMYTGEGLAVDIHPGGPDLSPAQLVASGADTFGVAAGPDILAARGHGVPIKAIAGIYQRNPVVFFSKTTAGIKTPKDFVGKKVGIKYGFDIEYEFPVLLKAAGVDPSRVKTEPIKYDMGQFFSGAIDVWSGYAINEPIVAEEKGVGVTTIHADDYGAVAAGDTLFTTEKLISTNPGMVQRFVNASIRGWQWAVDHPDEAANIVVQVDPHLDREHQVRMLNAAIPLIKPKANTRIGQFDPQTWAGMRDMLVGAHILPTNLAANDSYTNSFFEHFFSTTK